MTAGHQAKTAAFGAKLPIAEIGELDAGLYVGMIDDAAIACLSVRLAAEGLLTPIWVRRNDNAAKTPWTVIAGRHRLRAATQLGWTEIAAEQRADATCDAGELRRLQIAENLDRRDLRPVERARFVMARWYDEAGSQGWATVAQAPPGDRRATDQATAAACGKSERWVRECRFLYEAIVSDLPDHAEALNAHQLGESRSAMMELAKLPMPERQKVAAQIVEDQGLASVGEAMARAGLRESNGTRHDPRKSHTRWRNDWISMSREDQHANFLDIAKTVPPSWVQQTIDELSRLLP